mgnify:CR=1 FL=1
MTTIGGFVRHATRLVVCGVALTGCGSAEEPMPDALEQTLMETTLARSVSDGTGDTGDQGEDLGISCGGGGSPGSFCCGVEWGGSVYFCCVWDGGGACG